MRNLKLTLEYDGTNYAGWQTQNSSRKKTIQETLEKALSKILQEKIKLTASGRTDSGVHALAQVANFKTKSDIRLKKLQAALNSTLPCDIAINKIEEIDSDFHSRFCARSKIYRYTVLNRAFASVFLKNRVYLFRYPLNVGLIKSEARVLLGKHDFKSFQAQDKLERKSIRTIKKLKITKSGKLIYIDIEADGFLHNMARNIAGTLLEIGRGKFPQGSLKKILLAKDRKLAGPCAPACGLCLMKVKY